MRKFGLSKTKKLSKQTFCNVAELFTYAWHECLPGSGMWVRDVQWWKHVRFTGSEGRTLMEA